MNWDAIGAIAELLGAIGVMRTSEIGIESSTTDRSYFLRSVSRPAIQAP